MANKHSKGSQFSLAAGTSTDLREFVSHLNRVFEPAHVSQSQSIEILLEHWKRHPPAPVWINGYDFRVRRGRPRVSVDPTAGVQ